MVGSLGKFTLLNKNGKLSKQTFISFRHACTALPAICNYLVENCGFSYLLTSFLQTDPLEHHFGLYRIMSGANSHIPFLQILETERRLRVSNILKLSSNQPDTNQLSIRTFIQSFTSMTPETTEDPINLDPFLDEIEDLSVIEFESHVLQALSFIAGYSIHQYLKRKEACTLCTQLLTLEKDFLLEELAPHSSSSYLSAIVASSSILQNLLLML